MSETCTNLQHLLVNSEADKIFDAWCAANGFLTKTK